MHAIFAQVAAPTDSGFWEQALERYGIGGVMMLGFFFGLWLLARWARPHVDRIIEGHNKVIETVCTELPQLREDQRRLTDAHEAQAKAQEATAILLDKHLTEEERNAQDTLKGINELHRRLDIIVQEGRDSRTRA